MKSGRLITVVVNALYDLVHLPNPISRTVTQTNGNPKDHTATCPRSQRLPTRITAPQPQQFDHDHHAMHIERIRFARLFTAAALSGNCRIYSLNQVLVHLMLLHRYPRRPVFVCMMFFGSHFRCSGGLHTQDGMENGRWSWGVLRPHLPGTGLRKLVSLADKQACFFRSLLASRAHSCIRRSTQSTTGSQLLQQAALSHQEIHDMPHSHNTL